MKDTTIEAPIALIGILMQVKEHLEDKETNHADEIAETMAIMIEAVKGQDAILARHLTGLSNKIHTWYKQDRSIITAVYVAEFWSRVFERLFVLIGESRNWRLKI